MNELPVHLLPPSAARKLWTAFGVKDLNVFVTITYAVTLQKMRVYFYNGLVLLL